MPCELFGFTEVWSAVTVMALKGSYGLEWLFLLLWFDGLVLHLPSAGVLRDFGVKPL